MVKNPVWY